VVAATAAAAGPAVPERTRLTWPPTTPPTTLAAREWLTPVLLARHTADAIDARVPCGGLSTVPGTGRSVILLATARDAVEWGGLEVVQSRPDHEVVVRVGRTRLARFSPRTGDPACTFHIEFDGSSWAITGAGGRTVDGSLASPPNVYGLMTQLDLRRRQPLRVTIDPIPQDTRASGRQTVLRILAVVLLVAAVALAVTPSLRRRRFHPRRASFAAQDLAVSLVLAAWWLLAPLQDDDGWVRARQTNYLASGGFSNYFKDWGANLPMAAWIEWLQHFLVANTTGLAVARLPALATLVVMWFVCRWCVARLTGTRPTRDSLVWWSTALAFLVGATAFGMTLRAEPLIALLTVGVLACCLAYTRRPSIDVLMLGVLLAAIASTTYPSGVISVAPLVLCIPRAVRDAHARVGVSPLELASLLPTGAAAVLLLEFVDSDVEDFRQRLDLFRLSGSHAKGISQEFDRYLHLSDAGASPLRRLFVALLFVSIMALLARVPRRPRLAQVLPSASIAVALVFLAVTPSKWIWHFGGFVGLCAVAIGTETHSLAEAQPATRARRVLMGVVLLFGVAAVSQANSWGPLDVGRIVLNHVPAIFMVAVLFAFGVTVLLGRRGLIARPDLALLPVSLAAVLGTTVFLFAADAAATAGWTTARQTVSSLIGRDGCGVASSIRVATPSGSRPPLAAPLDRSGWTRWYPVSGGAHGVFVSDRRSTHDALVVQWGARARDRPRVLAEGRAELGESGRDPAQWRFVPDSGFPVRPAGANLVRFRLAIRSAGEDALITGPMRYSWRTLGALMSREGTRSFVSPLLFEAMPCARLPRLANGVLEAPDYLVDFNYGITLTDRSSPALGMVDVGQLQRLPVRSSVRSWPIFVYRTGLNTSDVLAPVESSAT
jgi:hypothetical protein